MQGPGRLLSALRDLMIAARPLEVATRGVAQEVVMTTNRPWCEGNGQTKD